MSRGSRINKCFAFRFESYIGVVNFIFTLQTCRGRNAQNPFVLGISPFLASVETCGGPLQKKIYCQEHINGNNDQYIIINLVYWTFKCPFSCQGAQITLSEEQTVSQDMYVTKQ